METIGDVLAIVEESNSCQATTTAAVVELGFASRSQIKSGRREIEDAGGD